MPAKVARATPGPLRSKTLVAEDVHLAVSLSNFGVSGNVCSISDFLTWRSSVRHPDLNASANSHQELWFSIIARGRAQD